MPTMNRVRMAFADRCGFARTTAFRIRSTFSGNILSPSGVTMTSSSRPDPQAASVVDGSAAEAGQPLEIAVERARAELPGARAQRPRPIRVGIESPARFCDGCTRA